MSAPRSLARTMTWAVVALIVYASLHPFTGWREPASWAVLGFWIPPWPHYWAWFDVAANALGYMPLGFFLAQALMARGHDGLRGLLGALAGAALLAWGMETVQQFIPVRVPSLLDALLNVAGAGLGALLGWSFQALGWVHRWHRLRDRWMVSDDGSALTLLLLWPVGLLVPTMTPMALGHVIEPLRAQLLDWSEDTWLHAWVAGPAESPVAPMAAGLEVLATVCGLLAPCLVAYTVVRKPTHRLVLAVGAAVLGVVSTSLATALNFGPDHALSWINRNTPSAFAAAGLLALASLWFAPRLVALGGIGVGLLGLVLVNLSPVDPYLTSSLQQWEQARFIRFHGVSQWIGWAWPTVALLYQVRALMRGPAR